MHTRMRKRMAPATRQPCVATCGSLERTGEFVASNFVKQARVPALILALEDLEHRRVRTVAAYLFERRAKANGDEHGRAPE